MDFKKGQKATKNSKRTGRYLLENYKLSVGRSLQLVVSHEWTAGQ